MPKNIKNNDIPKKARGLLTPALVFHTSIVATSARGVRVEGEDGRSYLDFASGLATTSLGHCPGEVVEAVKGQAERLLQAGCIFYFPEVVELAEKLKGITPGSIEKFFFSNSGTEAVEGALKLARLVTGRQGIVAFTGSFHGRTLGAVSLTSSTSKYRCGYHPLLPGVYHAPYPYCYRCPVGKSEDDCSTECFDAVERITTDLISPSEIACVIIEPVLGEGGYVVPPKEFLTRLRDFCTEHGILLILDEVQSGFGRTGKWFASEHFDIVPDIMTMAKGIAGGLPLGAIGASSAIMDRWPPGAHGTTFGGNPLSCAAAIAVIDAIEERELLENVRAVGEAALKRLGELNEKELGIGDVRGMGFMIGIEFVRGDSAPDAERIHAVIESCLDMGLIIVECGREKNVARLMPPLVTTMEEMNEALDIFEAAVKETNE